MEVLKGYSESTQQTYAYGLADHSNWLKANRLTVASVTADDLRRYKRAFTGRGSGIFGGVARPAADRWLGWMRCGDDRQSVLFQVC